MKKIVKPLFFAVLSIALTTASFSQVRLPGNALAADIKKIIRDYPNHFSSLIGPVIDENPQTVDYECNFKVSGAESSVITRYSSKAGNIFSWQAEMLTTESFEEAKKKFKYIYSTFNHLSVKMDYGDTFYLSGHYEDPVEEKIFTSSILSFENADNITQKMKLEVTMQFEQQEWKVKVIVYEREREDTEPGDRVDEG